MQENPSKFIPFVAIKHKNFDQSIYESVWFAILDTVQMETEKKVKLCYQIDVNEEELREIRSIKFAQNKIISKNDDPKQLLPKGCESETSYQICIWFGDDKWLVKIIEYRVR